MAAGDTAIAVAVAVAGCAGPERRNGAANRAEPPSEQSRHQNRADESCSYKVTKGLLDRFGEKRVIDSPITESGFAGLTVGAALAGLHPVVSSADTDTSHCCCSPR